MPLTRTRDEERSLLTTGEVSEERQYANCNNYFSSGLFIISLGSGAIFGGFLGAIGGVYIGLVSDQREVELYLTGLGGTIFGVITGGIGGTLVGGVAAGAGCLISTCRDALFHRSKPTQTQGYEDIETANRLLVSP